MKEIFEKLNQKKEPMQQVFYDAGSEDSGIIVEMWDDVAHVKRFKGTVDNILSIETHKMPQPKFEALGSVMGVDMSTEPKRFELLKGEE